MKENEQDFYVLMGKIISAETDRTNNDTFSIDGERIVNNLFNGGVIVDEGASLPIDMGFSPVELEVGKTSVEFISIIVSLFNIYVNTRDEPSCF